MESSSFNSIAYGHIQCVPWFDFLNYRLNIEEFLKIFICLVRLLQTKSGRRMPLEVCLLDAVSSVEHVAHLIDFFEFDEHYLFILEKPRLCQVSIGPFDVTYVSTYRDACN